MAVTKFLHVKLDVADLDRSLRFYCDGLGLGQLVRYDRDDGITIVQVALHDQGGIELWREDGHRGFADDRLHLAFAVSELEDQIARACAAGGRIEQTPSRIGHERIAFLRDPDGYLVELNEIEAP